MNDDSKDAFLKYLAVKKVEAGKNYQDAILFARSEAHSPKAREFVESCASQLKTKGYLSEKQVTALFRVGSDIYSSNSNYPDDEDEGYEGEWDGYNDLEGIPNR